MTAEELTINKPIDKEKVKGQIYNIRGLRVMLDKDIAVYFGVTTGNLICNDLCQEEINKNHHKLILL